MPEAPAKQHRYSTSLDHQAGIQCQGVSGGTDPLEVSALRAPGLFCLAVGGGLVHRVAIRGL